MSKKGGKDMGGMKGRKGQLQKFKVCIYRAFDEFLDHLEYMHIANKYLEDSTVNTNQLLAQHRN